MLLPAGFIAIAAGIVLWTDLALGRASAACGDSPSVARGVRWRYRTGALIWLSVVLGLAASGVLAQWERRPPPFILVAASIGVLGIVIARSSVGDRLARGLPLASLVGLQAFRLPLELLMHQTAVAGVMPEQMSYSGRNFDIITGITALLLAIGLRTGRPPQSLVMAWNVMGLILLANIVTVAILSTPQFAVFGSTPDRVNTFVTRVPYVLLPTVMVLAAWAGHLIVFRAMRRGGNTSPGSGASTPRQKRRQIVAVRAGPSALRFALRGVGQDGLGFGNLPMTR